MNAWISGYELYVDQLADEKKCCRLGLYGSRFGLFFQMVLAEG